MKDSFILHHDTLSVIDELTDEQAGQLIKEIYGEDGYEWFSWYCYDNEFGQKDWSTTPTCKMKENGTTELINEAGEVRFGAHDAEGNPICYSHESLWEYLEKNHQVYKVVKRI